MNFRLPCLATILMMSIILSGCGLSAEQGEATTAAGWTVTPPAVVQTATPTKRVDPSPTPLASNLDQNDPLFQAMIARCSEETTSNSGSNTSNSRPIIAEGSLYSLIEQDGVWMYLPGMMNGSQLTTADPAQAEYLLCVQETKTLVGYYTDSDPGYRVAWEISLVSFPEKNLRRTVAFTGKEPPEMKDFVGPAYGEAPFGELLAWVNSWEAPPAGSRKSIMTLSQEMENPISLALAFTPDGQTLVAGEDYGGVHLYHVIGREYQGKLEGHKGEIRGLALTPDGTRLAVIDRDYMISVWDWATMEQISTFNIQVDMPASVALSPDGRLVVVGTGGGQILVYNATSGENLFFLGQKTASLASWVVISPDGKRLMGIQAGPAMVTWDLATGQEISRIPAPARLMGMALVNEGQNLAAASETGDVIVWNMDGSVKFNFQAVTNSAVAFSPDGRLLALGGYNGEVTLWDLQTGKASEITLAGPADSIRALAFSPDSRRLAASAWDALIYIWDVSQPLAATTYLSQLQPTSVELGYGTYSAGKFKFSSDDPADNVHYNDPIFLDGVESPHGIFAHAPSRLVYNLGSHSYIEFSATVGLIDKISCGDGAEFIVLLDGEEIYRSGVRYPWSMLMDIHVPISGGSELTLIVDPGPDGNSDCDWGIWSDAGLR
jgi:WD40 repeat protein